MVSFYSDILSQMNYDDIFDNPYLSKFCTQIFYTRIIMIITIHFVIR